MIPPGVLTQQVAGANVLLAKCAAWWECNETGTGTRFDSHSNHDITVLSGVIDVPGLIGNAMDFGGNDEAKTANVGWPSGTGSFAMSMWVHFDTRTDNDMLCIRMGYSASGTTVPASWHVAVYGSNYVYFVIEADGSMNDWDGTNANTSTGTPETVAAGSTYWVYWHYDSGTDEMAISLNNGPLHTATLANTFYTAGNSLRFGRMTSSFPHGLDGWEDIINYWNEPLTAAERTWLYNSGSGRTYAEAEAYVPA